MTPEQAGNYLTAVLSTAVVGVIIPLLILVGLMVGLRVMLRHANDHPEGFFARMMQDNDGKPSSDRLIKLVALAITSWMAAVVVFSQPQLLAEVLIIYMAGWGGVDLTKYWLSTRAAVAAAGSEKRQ